MRILSVIPFTKGMGAEELTYFSSVDAPVGHIVEIPLRNKKVLGLVAESFDMRERKVDIKQSPFDLKKISQVLGQSIFSENFLKSCGKIAKFYANNTGAILNSAIPKIFLENHQKLSDSTSFTNKNINNTNLISEKLILQEPLEDRISFHKIQIREALAREESVFIMLPTISETEYFYEKLKKGIEDFCIIVHSEIPKKKILEAFGKAYKKNTVIIIGTGQFLSIPIKNLKTIIVERESSSAYKTFSRPYLDYRLLAEMLCAQIGGKIILADTYLRIETLGRKDLGELIETRPLSFRWQKNRQIEIIESKRKPARNAFSIADAGKEDVKFEALGKEIKEEITNILKNKKKIFLFTLRKGLATETLCGDCGEIISCPDCSAPLVLYKKESGRILSCNRCGFIKSPEALLCSKCGSWNLKTLGIGTELIEEETKKAFPKAKIFILDKEKYKTRSSAKKEILLFEKAKEGILIATEMALFYLKEKIEKVIVVSFDSLWNIPGYRMNERILNLLLVLNSFSEKPIVIKTKNPNEEILIAIKSGNLSELMKNEIEARKKFNYPPFSTLLKISFLGSKVEAEKARETAQNLLADFGPIKTPTRAYKDKKVGFSFILKIPRAKWSLPEFSQGAQINPALEIALKLLPQSLSIDIAPEEII